MVKKIVTPLLVVAVLLTALIFYTDVFTPAEDAEAAGMQLLQSAGCVTDQYMLDVYRREMLGPTIYRNAIAIPHGTTQNVLHPAVAVGLLPAPIEWMPDVMVDKVFLLALPEDSHDVVCRLRQIFDDKSFLSQISALHNPSEIKDILTEHILLNVSSENFS